MATDAAAGVNSVPTEGSKSPKHYPGHLLKDPDATVNYHLGKLPYAGAFLNAPIQVDATLEAVEKALVY